MGTVFLISVLMLPTEAQRIEGQRKSFLVQPQFLIADDTRAASNKAALLAAKENPNLDPDRIEVLVRPAF